MKTKIDKEILDAMGKDPGNWRGPFYFNRKDPRVLVPKLYPSMGWTCNFACPYTYLALASFVAIVVLVKMIAH